MSANDAAALTRETRSSIELTLNAKGDYQWTAKVYFEEGGETPALLTLGFIDHELRSRYLPPARAEPQKGGLTP